MIFSRNRASGDRDKNAVASVKSGKEECNAFSFAQRMKVQQGGQVLFPVRNAAAGKNQRGTCPLSLPDKRLLSGGSQ
jgi:hypothetical protein